MTRRFMLMKSRTKRALFVRGATRQLSISPWWRGALRGVFWLVYRKCQGCLPQPTSARRLTLCWIGMRSWCRSFNAFSMTEELRNELVVMMSGISVPFRVCLPFDPDSFLAGLGG